DSKMMEHLYVQLKKIIEKDSKLFSLLEEEHIHSGHVLAQLKADIKEYDKEVVQLHDIYSKASNTLEENQRLMYEKIEINKQFDLLEEYRIEIDELSKTSKMIEEKQTILQEARKATVLEPYETQIQTKEKEWNEHKIVMQETDVKLSEANQALIKTKKEYDLQKDKQTELDKLKQQLNQYVAYEPIVQNMENIANELENE